MKVYKLKEEVKKYLPKSLHEKKLQLASWDAIGKNQDIESLITGEAIEEVESIKVIKTKTQQYEVNYLHKIGEDWTEEEREFIEFCLNEIGSKEKLDVLVDNHFKGVCNNEIGGDETFTEHLDLLNI